MILKSVRDVRLYTYIWSDKPDQRQVDQIKMKLENGVERQTGN